MSAMEQPPEENTTYELSCPLLGIGSDQETRFGFPNQGNRCHRFSPPATITLTYQQQMCLSGQYASCPVYQNSSPDVLPDGVQPIQKGLIATWMGSRAFIVVISLIVLVFASFKVANLIRSSRREALAYASTQTQRAESFFGTETSLSSTMLAPSATPIPTNTFTPVPSSTPTPLPSATPTEIPPTTGPDIGTPFGPNASYILHRVRAGESLQVIASQYNTRGGVISVVNSLTQGLAIQPDQVLVILPGVTNTIGLIPLQPVFIRVETSVSDLAAFYNVSEIDLRRYNSLGSGDRILAERWIIVPVISEANP